MSISYSKQITLTYLIFSLVAAILFEIGKVSLMPIALGLTLYMLFFGIKTLKGFFRENSINKMDLLIYWGLTTQFSLQIALVFLKGNRYELLIAFIVVFVTTLVLCIRNKSKKDLILLNFLIMMFSGTIYFNF